jgi:hypothetical protein
MASATNPDIGRALRNRSAPASYSEGKADKHTDFDICGMASLEFQMEFYFSI